MDDAIRDALRDRAPICPAPRDWNAVLRRADAHGVVCLLADAAVRNRWPPELIERMRPAIAAEAVLAMVRERELRRVLAAFRVARVRSLIFKGGHVAFALYPSPDLRPRLDTDFLVDEADRAAAVTVLHDLGYAAASQVTGEIAFGQCQFDYVDASAAQHTIDLHWRIANPLAFAGRLTFDELWRGAVDVPSLGGDARGPSPAHATLIACLHRIAHHRASHRLIWLYDIHLLCATLDAAAWDHLTTLTIDRRLASIVVDGLAAARDALGTVVPPRAEAALRAHDDADRDAATFIAGASTMAVMASDWGRLSGWRQRAAFLREHLFPSPDYMTRKYRPSSSLVLPALYVWRMFAGAWRIGRRETFNSAFRP
jgi:Uncharacterised nucleotidyltransferase